MWDRGCAPADRRNNTVGRRTLQRKARRVRPAEVLGGTCLRVGTNPLAKYVPVERASDDGVEGICIEGTMPSIAARPGVKPGGGAALRAGQKIT